MHVASTGTQSLSNRQMVDGCCIIEHMGGFSATSGRTVIVGMGVLSAGGPLHTPSLPGAFCFRSTTKDERRHSMDKE